MNIDTGLAAVIFAILIFYLRLIILQRERTKRNLARLAAQRAAPKGKGKRPLAPPRFSILSHKRSNWIIAAVGAAAIVAGLLLNAGLAFPSLQAYWWVPMAVGIVAFSWAFGLDDRNEHA